MPYRQSQRVIINLSFFSPQEIKNFYAEINEEQSTDEI